MKNPSNRTIICQEVVRDAKQLIQAQHLHTGRTGHRFRHPHCLHRHRRGGPAPGSNRRGQGRRAGPGGVALHQLHNRGVPGHAVLGRPVGGTGGLGPGHRVQPPPGRLQLALFRHGGAHAGRLLPDVLLRARFGTGTAPRRPAHLRGHRTVLRHALIGLSYSYAFFTILAYSPLTMNGLTAKETSYKTSLTSSRHTDL